MTELVLLTDSSTGVIAKASSVLQKNSKLYGAANALDCLKPSSCWSSDGSKSGKDGCSLLLTFKEAVQPVSLRIQYQAGFAAEEVAVLVLIDNDWKTLVDLETEDDHDLQKFDLQSESSPTYSTKSIKLVFESCTDFYGRVTVYQLQVWGNYQSEESKSGVRDPTLSKC